MHTLHLLRHAKSSWTDPDLADHQRPLARRGRRDARRVARHLVHAGITPELVLCSSAARTRESLELVRPALASSAQVMFENDLYGADADALLDRLRALREGVASVMLVGHNPGLHDLALILASSGADLPRLENKFPTAALATLAIPSSSWNRLDHGDADLSAYITPKQLGRAR
jgi:phosphohistidine phosphatase